MIADKHITPYFTPQSHRDKVFLSFLNEKRLVGLAGLDASLEQIITLANNYKSKKPSRDTNKLSSARNAERAVQYSQASKPKCCPCLFVIKRGHVLSN